MPRIIDQAARVLETILALALIASVAINFANVIGRYGFGRTLTVADELQTYAMVWMAYLGAAIVTWRGLHLRMDVISARLPPAFRAALGAIEVLLFVVLGGLVTWVAWQYTAQMYGLGAKSQTAGIPMWIPHAALLAGFALMVAMAVLKAAARR